MHFQVTELFIRGLSTFTVCVYVLAGIKEGLYDVESLASYLLYRFNILDPIGAFSLPLCSTTY